MKLKNKQEAVTLLMQLFHERKLSFRDMALLRAVFDEAVEACNGYRSELQGEADMGRTGPVPVELYDRDAEDDFYAELEARAKARLPKGSSKETVSSVAELILELEES